MNVERRDAIARKVWKYPIMRGMWNGEKTKLTAIEKIIPTTSPASIITPATIPFNTFIITNENRFMVFSPFYVNEMAVKTLNKGF